MKNNSWQTKKLGEVIELKYGKGIGRHERNENADYPVYGANGILGRTDKAWTSGEAIIVGRKGSAGEVTRISGKFLPSDVTYYVFGNNHINIDYLFYFFQLVDLRRLARGVKPGINRNDVYSLNIKVPQSLSEQKSIVTLLDRIFGKIEKAKKNAEKNLQNSRELFEAYSKNIFIDPRGNTQSFGEVSKNLDSKRIPVTKRDRINGEYPYYGASGIVDYVNKYIFDENLLLVSEDGSNLLARTYPIAFSISGKSWVNNHAHVIKFKKRETQKFYEFYLNSIDLSPYVSGMAQPKLNQNSLNSIKVPSPPIEEQSKIVKQLDELSMQTRKLEEIYKKKLVDLEELKKSVLQSAFTPNSSFGETKKAFAREL